MLNTNMQSTPREVFQTWKGVELARRVSVKREHSSRAKITTVTGLFHFTVSLSLIFTHIHVTNTLICHILLFCILQIMIKWCDLVLWQNLIMHHVDHSGGLLIDLLQGLLKFEPSERLTAKEALKHPFFKESNRRL